MKKGWEGLLRKSLYWFIVHVPSTSGGKPSGTAHTAEPVPTLPKQGGCNKDEPGE